MRTTEGATKPGHVRVNQRTTEGATKPGRVRVNMRTTGGAAARSVVTRRAGVRGYVGGLSGVGDGA